MHFVIRLLSKLPELDDNASHVTLMVGNTICSQLWANCLVSLLAEGTFWPGAG